MKTKLGLGKVAVLMACSCLVGAALMAIGGERYGK
jgi:hypothetical protein